MVEQIKQIVQNFDIDGEILDIKCNSQGNINQTFIVTFKMNDGSLKDYVFQKINTTVFKEPYKLMRNILNITDFISKKESSLEKKHPSLKVIRTKDNQLLTVIKGADGEQEYYRSYNAIENSISFDVSYDSDVVFNTGKAFGHFQKLLFDYPIETLEETIPDFHNTKKRYQEFLNDVKLDVVNRVFGISKEIEFLKQNSNCVSLITDLIDSGKIPIKVTHNDAKVNNVMLDRFTKEYLTVIDLDTVMPGSFLYDYGDGIRSACSRSKEDELDLSKVSLDNGLFEKYTDGYLSEMAPFLNKYEISNMYNSIEVITFELGLRFLDDYINGDTYFKTKYKTHNLDRARNQLKLLYDIKSKKEYINSYILKTYEKEKIKVKKW